MLPDAKIHLKDVAVGAAFTAVLFLFGKFLIGLYLGNSQIGTQYGAAGSVVVLMVWVYYSSIILYFGAEFTQVYSRRLGKRIYPNSYAVFIETKEVELSGSK
jgi:membrane protein